MMKTQVVSLGAAIDFYKKKYREENREKIAENKKKYYEENREKWVVYKKRYREKRRLTR